MPLVSNVPFPNDKKWKKTFCPICGNECWETPQLRWAKKAGMVDKAACTECAISGKEEINDTNIRIIWRQIGRAHV